jgi:hypothetical protein
MEAEEMTNAHVGFSNQEEAIMGQIGKQVWLRVLDVLEEQVDKTQHLTPDATLRRFAAIQGMLAAAIGTISKLLVMGRPGANMEMSEAERSDVLRIEMRLSSAITAVIGEEFQGEGMNASFASGHRTAAAH